VKRIACASEADAAGRRRPREREVLHAWRT
jgi:hypothetical protein